MLTHKQIMSSRFKCDDGIWRNVFRHENNKYIMVLPDKDGKNQFVPVQRSWFDSRKREVIRK